MLYNCSFIYQRFGSEADEQVRFFVMAAFFAFFGAMLADSVYQHCISKRSGLCDVLITTERNILFVSVYLLLSLVAHLSDAPRRWLVVTGDGAMIQGD